MRTRQLLMIKIRRDREGVILCFVGPPGVGKTSLGTIHCARHGPQVRARLAGRRA